MEEKRFDLHLHSNCSDGADTPAEVVEKASAQHLLLMALTDHDTIDGVRAAQNAAEGTGICLLPSIEMDTEWPSEMHILGLDVDVQNADFLAALSKAKARRIERNRVILEKLSMAGYEIAPFLTRACGSVTKLHIALALVNAGFATDIADAFSRFLRRGCPGYYTVERFSPEEVVSIILGASGVPVWAHPFHGHGNLHAEFEMLLSAGIAGVEAYHPSASAGQSEILLSLARQKHLLVTCGSDSHGANRPGVVPGCTWRACPPLAETYDFFLARHTPA